MKIFLDTADTEIIRKHYKTGLIDGVTTNPSLILKSGRDPEDVYQEIKDIGVKDISMEVVGDAETMWNEAIRLVDKFGSVSTIKLPMTRDGLWVCKELSKGNVRTNVTLCFSAAQAVMAAKAGATYISPFVGRMNDNSFSGVELVRAIVGLYCAQGVKTKVLAASLRDVHHVSRCLMYGANVVTLPPTVFDKMYNHVLTDSGLAIFEKDFKEING